MKTPPLLLLLLVLCSSFIAKAEQTNLKNGAYQFSIHRSDGKDIVFTSLIKDSLNKQIMWINNGKNQMLVDSIIVKNDSVFIELPFFESGFSALILPNGDLEGNWIKRAADKERAMPFSAKYGVRSRFEFTEKASKNFTGRYEVTFLNEEKSMSAIAEFDQKGSTIYGTFLTPYGDYRYLEGLVSGNQIYLSGFDGSYALLFTAKIKNNNTIVDGKLYSGAAQVQTWTGFKNPDAALPQSGEMTVVNKQTKPLNFSFPDLESNLISLSDQRFKNKVVVIQVMGSWCPNCLDETKFLVGQYEKYKKMGVEFIGISFERTADFKKSQQALTPFKKRLNPPYPILIPPVAVSDPKMTEKVFPELSKIQAFPTTIFFGKDGFVKEVHSGFDGPATGVHYVEYQQHFEHTILKLLKEE